MQPAARAELRVQIMRAGLDHVVANGAVRGASIDSFAADELSMRRGLEQAYRDAARLAPAGAQRAALVDLANDVRPRTWV